MAQEAQKAQALLGYIADDFTGGATTVAQHFKIVSPRYIATVVGSYCTTERS